MNAVFYIGGPTSSGKTSLSIDLAKKIPNARFINADTMQLYQGIGSLASLPDDEELRKIDHRLFGILDPSRDFSRQDWYRSILVEIKKSFEDKKNSHSYWWLKKFFGNIK